MNNRGEVVGVNTLAANKSEYSGLNFSISSNELARLVEAHFGVSLHPTALTAATGSISVSISVQSNPSGADIQIDGVFVGSTPSDIPVQAGDHHITVSRSGYKPYERTLRVLAGAKQSISAELERDSK